MNALDLRGNNCAAILINRCGEVLPIVLIVSCPQCRQGIRQALPCCEVVMEICCAAVCLGGACLL